MRKAIDKYASGNLVFSLCPWGSLVFVFFVALRLADNKAGWDSVWQWGAEFGESWRVSLV